MSAVVSVAKAVVKPVAKAVEQVGEVLEDVGDAVEQVVETIAENPEILVIAVAAPYAIQAVGTQIGAAVGASKAATAATIAKVTAPITAAAITASQGGDLEDIGKAALTAFVAPEVGKAAGGATAEAIAGSGMSNAMQQTVVNTISSGAAGATAAAIQGGDIGATAALGAAGGAAGTIAGIGAAELGAPESTIPYAETAARVAAQGGDVGYALAQQGISDITKSLKDRPKDGPMTREELADATYELLQEELAALEGRPPREGVQVAEADMSDRPPLRIDIEGVGDMTSEPREGGPDEVPETTLPRVEVSADREATLPTVDVIADMDVGALTDAQLIDLVRAGQRRRQEAARPAEGAAAPAEGEQVMPETVVEAEGGEQPVEGAESDRVMETTLVEADAIDDEISDEEILELVRLGMDRAEAPDEELPEGEMELGGGEGEGIPEGEMELGGGEGEGEPPVTPRVTMPPVVADRITRRGAVSLTPRQVGQGYSAIVGDKEPTFGGDPGQQQEVWNQRSLRLRKALGL